MKKNHSVTAFYFETLLLIVVFLFIILALTQVFSLARMQSASARQLTDAVALAGNAAEAFSYSGSPDALRELLNEQDNAGALPDKTGVFARYNAAGQPDAKGAFRVEITWEPEERPGDAGNAGLTAGETEAGTQSGTLVRSEIRVLYGDERKEIYRLKTASYKGAEA